jgi:cell division protein FtsX
MLILGAITGALLGLCFAMLQVIALRRYARGKAPEIAQRAYDAIDQLKITSFLGLPLIFAVIGYMTANALWPQS